MWYLLGLLSLLLIGIILYVRHELRDIQKAKREIEDSIAKEDPLKIYRYTDD